MAMASHLQPPGRIARALAGAFEVLLTGEAERTAAAEGWDPTRSPPPALRTAKSFLSAPPPYATDDVPTSLSQSHGVRPAEMVRRRRSGSVVGTGAAPSMITTSQVTHGAQQSKQQNRPPQQQGIGGRAESQHVDAAVAAWIASPESSEAAASLAALVSPNSSSLPSPSSQQHPPLRRRTSSTGPNDPVPSTVPSPILSLDAATSTGASAVTSSLIESSGEDGDQRGETTPIEVNTGASASSGAGINTTSMSKRLTEFW